jgi:hypothetical protein
VIEACNEAERSAQFYVVSFQLSMKGGVELRLGFVMTAEKQRKFIDEHFITRDKTDYCSIDDTAHYSDD